MLASQAGRRGFESRLPLLTYVDPGRKLWQEIDGKNAPGPGCHRARGHFSEPFDPLLAGSVDPFVVLDRKVLSMARPRKLWYRKARQAVYVEIDGKQHLLAKGPDNDETWERARLAYHRLMAEILANPPVDGGDALPIGQQRRLDQPTTAFILSSAACALNEDPTHGLCREARDGCLLIRPPMLETVA